MKVTIDTEKVVAKSVELGVKGFDKVKSKTPDVKSFFGRVKKAAEKGKKAARS